MTATLINWWHTQVDVTKLDIGQVHNYAMWLAVSTWRQLVAAQSMRAGGGLGDSRAQPAHGILQLAAGHSEL